MQQQLFANILTYAGGIIALLFGFVYLVKSSFLYYHKAAVEKDWANISPLFQTLILALMRATSGGVIASGFSIIVLQYYFNITNLYWIPPIILMIGVVISVCSLYAMLLVRLNSRARPPMFIIIISFILNIAGYTLNMGFWK